ncbi:hypothetical protein [Hyphomicrobium sp. MC8b]|uniref:hypothetical protein n=1 Tax=Hyphomicrobium sp. MC8b TaxID=300273 RepID=UPI003919F47F
MPEDTKLSFKPPEEFRTYKVHDYGIEPRPSFKVVSFYTENNEYADHAKRLKHSLTKKNIDHELFATRDNGCWESVCARKAKFVRDRWHSSEVPIVWLDADATVERFPDIFQILDVDFAIHKWNGWQFAGGTIYFGKTASAEELIDRWVSRCEADPITWDQTHLQSAWCDVSARTKMRSYWLPRSYCQIFDAPEEAQPTIKHWQASRKSKQEGRASIHPQLEITADGVNQRRRNQSWRATDKSQFKHNDEVLRRWRGHPDSLRIGSALKNAVANQYPVLDVSCGTGANAFFFGPDAYVGIDRSPECLVEARSSFPRHVFRIFDDGYSYPSAPSVVFVDLFYSILDHQLPTILKPILDGRSRAVIAETMADERGNRGRAPFQVRSSKFYISTMRRLGFSLSTIENVANAFNGANGLPFVILSFVKTSSDSMRKQNSHVKHRRVMAEIIGHFSRMRSSLLPRS